MRDHRSWRSSTSHVSRTLFQTWSGFKILLLFLIRPHFTLEGNYWRDEFLNLETIQRNLIGIYIQSSICVSWERNEKDRIMTHVIIERNWLSHDCNSDTRWKFSPRTIIHSQWALHSSQFQAMSNAAVWWFFAPLLTSNQVIDVQILSAWAIGFSLDYIWRFVLEATLDASADNLEHCS